MDFFFLGLTNIIGLLRSKIYYKFLCPVLKKNKKTGLRKLGPKGPGEVTTNPPRGYEGYPFGISYNIGLLRSKISYNRSNIISPRDRKLIHRGYLFLEVPLPKAILRAHTSHANVFIIILIVLNYLLGL
jgi:hypothetical protein